MWQEIFDVVCGDHVPGSLKKEQKVADLAPSVKTHMVLPAVWQILVIRWCMVDLVNVFGLAPAKVNPPWTASHDGWLFVCVVV